MPRIAIHAAGVLLIAAFMLLGPAASATSDLSQLENEGRALFLTGRINGPPPYAVVGSGNVTVPATAVPCASCHGRDGRGRAERGVVPPNITWQALSAPDAGSGHQRAPYSETSVILATGVSRMRPGSIMGRLGVVSAPSLDHLLRTCCTHVS
jgi:hypothetical protein